MTLQKQTIFILFFMFFGCQSETPNDEPNASVESGFCENEKALLSGFQSDPIVDIDFDQSFQSNLKLILNSTRQDTCICTNYFTFSIPTKTTSKKIDVRARVIDHCDDCVIGCPSSIRNQFQILINQHGQFLIEDEIGDIDSIKTRLTNYYKEEWDDRNFFCVSVLWDEATEQRILNSAILEIVETYLKYQEQLAIRNYGKTVCELSLTELLELEEIFEFRLELGFGNEERFSVISTHG